MHLYDLYIVPYIIPWGNYNFPRSTNKIQLFYKISTSGKKIVDLMKYLNYENQSIFPLWGMVKINFRDRHGKPNIYSKNSSHYQFFCIKFSKNDTLVYKKPLPTQMHLYSLYMVPYMIPWRNYNFARSTNKIQFLMKFPHLEKNVDLMKDLKYENQSTFSLWGMVKLNFRDRHGKPNIYSKNSSHYQFFCIKF